MQNRRKRLFKILQKPYIRSKRLTTTVRKRHIHGHAYKQVPTYLTGRYHPLGSWNPAARYGQRVPERKTRRGGLYRTPWRIQNPRKNSPPPPSPIQPTAVSTTLATITYRSTYNLRPSTRSRWTLYYNKRLVYRLLFCWRYHLHL